MFRTMAGSPAVLRSYLGFLESLAEGSLGPAVREQIALAVAERNRCDYCLSAHTALGKLAGLSVIHLTGAREGTATDAKAAAAIRFALAVVESAGDVSDADLARVRSAGCGDAEIGEIIAHVALNVLTNYFNRAARTVVDFPRVEPALRGRRPCDHGVRPAANAQPLGEVRA